jgi:hypothetical protein
VRRKCGAVVTLRGMDVDRILDDLRLERDQLSEAISAIERLGASGQRRRGRPPAWLAAVKRGESDGPKRRGRPRKVSGE